MRLPTTLVLLGLAAALLFGCGGSSDSTTTSPQGGDKAPSSAKAGSAAKVRAAWARSPTCRRPAGASRWGCSVPPYLCQAVVSGRGWSVDCAKPGRSIGFTVRSRK